MVRSEETATHGAVQRRGARRLLRAFRFFCIVAGAVGGMNQMVQGACCICEGVPPEFLGNPCFSDATLGRTLDCSAPPTDMNSCAFVCGEAAGSVRACCDSVGGCGGGVAADTCQAALDENVCLQQAIGFGFCDGTCAGIAPTATPTTTPTATPTSTLTNTPTVTPTNTPTATSTVTPTATPTSTPTNSPTATPTNTGIPQGSACSTSAACSTGFCVDGVCCNTACTDPLMRCNLPGQVGTCASDAASAPTLTPWGLLVGSVMLAGIAGMALRRRMRSR